MAPTHRNEVNGVTVHTYLGLISRHTPHDPNAPMYPAVILPTTPEWDLAGREVLVIRDPGDSDHTDLLDRADRAQQATEYNPVALIAELAEALRATLAQRDEARTARVVELEAALRDAIDWMDDPEGGPSSNDLVDRWRALVSPPTTGDDR
jgi:hypothetical protein